MRDALALSASPELAAAYAALYRQHFAFVWRSLRRLGVAERELADGAQEVFLLVFRKLPELDLESRLTTWLYAVCMRVASDWRRRAHRRYELVDVDQRGSAPAAAEDPHLGELRALLLRALDAMPMEQRAVFVAFEMEGFTGDEIASALEVPVPTVHSRLRLARERFRAVLERERKTAGKPPGGVR
jgi:RNA polymerase sigma-70 factor (ECF subfamily)